MTAATPEKKSAVLAFVVTTVLGAVADLGSKAWAEGLLKDLPTQAKMIASPWLEIALSYNRGTAFSAVVDLGGDMRFVFGVGAMLVVAFLLWTVLREGTSRLESLAYGMLAGGAIGNGWDRMFREAPGGGTGVVDFVKVNYPWGGSWPTFNVADALLVVGVALLLIGWFQASRALNRQAS